MDACIRAEFDLSDHEYRCLLRTFHTRFGVQYVEDLVFLTPTEVVVSDKWEVAAMRRLVEIVVTQIGVEKLNRTHVHVTVGTGESARLPVVSGSRRPGKGARAQTTRTDHEVDDIDMPIAPVSSDDHV